MNTLTVTPEMFCWQYSAGCLTDSLIKGYISQKEYDSAMMHCEMQTIPKPLEVRLWSPRPFAELEKNGEPCTLEMMQHYWRYLHRGTYGKIEESPVYVAKIITVDEARISAKEETAYSLIKLPGGGRILTAKNAHNLNLSFGDIVMIHGDIIAELAPKNLVLP